MFLKPNLGVMHLVSLVHRWPMSYSHQSNQLPFLHTTVANNLVNCMLSCMTALFVGRLVDSSGDILCIGASLHWAFAHKYLIDHNDLCRKVINSTYVATLCYCSCWNWIGGIDVYDRWALSRHGKLVKHATPGLDSVSINIFTIHLYALLYIGGRTRGHQGQYLSHKIYKCS